MRMTTPAMRMHLTCVITFGISVPMRMHIIVMVAVGVSVGVGLMRG